MHTLLNDSICDLEVTYTESREKLQSRTKYMTNVEKSSKIGQEKKRMEGRLDTGLCLHRNLRFF